MTRFEAAHCVTRATFTFLPFLPQRKEELKLYVSPLTYTIHHYQPPKNMEQPKQATRPATCAHLGLSAELRNRIFHLALVNKEPVEIDPRSLPTRLALTQTCTQIRAEASQIFFAANTFRAEGNASHLVRVATWLSGLEDQALLISSLTLAPTGDGPVDALSITSAIRSDGIQGRTRMREEFQEICNAAWADAIKVNHAFRQVVEQEKLRRGAVEVVDGGGEVLWCERVESAFFRTRFELWRKS